MAVVVAVGVAVGAVPVVAKFVRGQRDAEREGGGVPALDHAVAHARGSLADHAEVGQPDRAAREVVAAEHVPDVTERAVERRCAPQGVELIEPRIDGGPDVRIGGHRTDHHHADLVHDVDVAVVDRVDVGDDVLDVVDRAGDRAAVLLEELVVGLARDLDLLRRDPCQRAATAGLRRNAVELGVEARSPERTPRLVDGDIGGGIGGVHGRFGQVGAEFMQGLDPEGRAILQRHDAAEARRQQRADDGRVGSAGNRAPIGADRRRIDLTQRAAIVHEHLETITTDRVLGQVERDHVRPERRLHREGGRKVPWKQRLARDEVGDALESAVLHRRHG